MTRHFIVRVAPRHQDDGIASYIGDEGRNRYNGKHGKNYKEVAQIWIGSSFSRELTLEAIEADITFEDVVSSVLNHEAVHWVLDKFVKEERTKKIGILKWVFRELKYSYDRMGRQSRASTALDFIFWGKRHDLEMGL